MKKQRRIIIKVGSSSLVLENGQLNNEFFSRLIKTISFLMHEGNKVVLVTSGAIAVGLGKLGLTKKPKQMALKQACAALGQATLMNEYEKYTSMDNILCAQILVNHDDFENRNRMVNLSNTLESLFENNILPIINENDALAVEEIKVGDNDTLASLIVPMINADMLVLVSDIDGLYDKNPKIYKDARKIDVVTSIDSSIDEMVGEITSNVGTGGMATKIKAARITTKAGCNMAIISATCVEKIVDLIKGEKVGTLFLGDENALHSKEHWMVFNAYAKGSIVVDNGASSAIKTRKSLLASGITKVEGNFKENNVIFILDEDGNKLAKGISNFNSEEIKQVIGKHSQEVKDILKSTKDEIVHASMMVLIEGDEYGTIK